MDLIKENECQEWYEELGFRPHGFLSFPLSMQVFNVPPNSCFSVFLGPSSQIYYICWERCLWKTRDKGSIYRRISKILSYCLYRVFEGIFIPFPPGTIYYRKRIQKKPLYPLTKSGVLDTSQPPLEYEGKRRLLMMVHVECNIHPSEERQERLPYD